MRLVESVGKGFRRLRDRGNGSNGEIKASAAAETTVARDPALDAFLEVYGAPVVEKSYYKLILLILCVALVLLVLNEIRLASALSKKQPVVVLVDQATGRATVQHEGAYKPSEVQQKFFLKEFVNLYYTENKHTVEENFVRVFYFLDGRLQEQFGKEIRTGRIKGILASDLVRKAKVLNVALVQSKTEPYTATVRWQRVSELAGPTAPPLIEEFDTTVSYRFTYGETDEDILYNPNGIKIVDYRTDKAFQAPEGGKR